MCIWQLALRIGEVAVVDRGELVIEILLWLYWSMVEEPMNVLEIHGV